VSKRVHIEVLPNTARFHAVLSAFEARVARLNAALAALAPMMPVAAPGMQPAPRQAPGTPTAPRGATPTPVAGNTAMDGAIPAAIAGAAAGAVTGAGRTTIEKSFRDEAQRIFRVGKGPLAAANFNRRVSKSRFGRLTGIPPMTRREFLESILTTEGRLNAQRMARTYSRYWRGYLRKPDDPRFSAGRMTEVLMDSGTRMYDRVERLRNMRKAGAFPTRTGVGAGMGALLDGATRWVGAKSPNALNNIRRVNRGFRSVGARTPSLSLIGMFAMRNIIADAADTLRISQPGFRDAPGGEILREAGAWFQTPEFRQVMAVLPRIFEAGSEMGRGLANAVRTRVFGDEAQEGWVTDMLRAWRRRVEGSPTSGDLNAEQLFFRYERSWEMAQRAIEMGFPGSGWQLRDEFSRTYQNYIDKEFRENVAPQLAGKRRPFSTRRRMELVEG
jgi:hypothetical protein